MAAVSQVDRRKFLKGTGALVVSFSMLGSRVQAQNPPALPGSLNATPELDSWIRINADGTATVFSGKVELGQGITTAIAQIAAEELDLPFERIQMIVGDSAQTPDEGYTAGSLSVENSGTAVRLAAAEARSILLDLAAEQLKVPKDQLVVTAGVITARGQTTPGVNYGQLFAGKKFSRKATGTVKPKSPDTHTIVGKSVPRLDMAGKIFGAPMYVQDVRIKGMLHARVLRPPRYGAQIERFDPAAVQALPGVVRVVRDGNFVAVVTEREEQAMVALERLKTSVTWQGGTKLPSYQDAYKTLLSLPKEDVVGKNQGTPDEAIKAAAKTLEATYYRPYQAHASLAPSAAVAHLDGGVMKVWSQTQGVFPLRRDLAKVLGMPIEKIHTVHAEGAGCYGHNGADDVACDAALLAKALEGRPVRVLWTRQDEMSWEPYGSAMVMQVKAGLDASGMIVGWDYHVWTDVHNSRPGGGTPEQSNLLAGWHISKPVMPPPKRDGQLPAGGGDRNALPLYDLPNIRVVKHTVATAPVRVSALRGLGAYGNMLALESFMDELAYLAGADPVEFRLRHMKDARAKAVMEEAAKKAGWVAKTKPAANGKGRGFAFGRYKNSAAFMALVMDVEVNRSTGVVRLVKATTAVDAGLIINPDGIRNQVEGGIIQSASWTMHEEVKFGENGIASVDWKTYPILNFLEVPQVEIHLINRPPEAAGGVGEVAHGPTVAAILNAVYDATGVRIREVPLTPERVKAALV